MSRLFVHDHEFLYMVGKDLLCGIFHHDVTLIIDTLHENYFDDSIFLVFPNKQVFCVDVLCSINSTVIPRQKTSP